MRFDIVLTPKTPKTPEISSSGSFWTKKNVPKPATKPARSAMARRPWRRLTCASEAACWYQDNGRCGVTKNDGNGQGSLNANPFWGNQKNANVWIFWTDFLDTTWRIISGLVSG